MTTHKKPAYSFDSKCYELARHFLPDTAPISALNDLAQGIQDTVEDYCAWSYPIEVKRCKEPQP